jgi:hypothetical protein
MPARLQEVINQEGVTALPYSPSARAGLQPHVTVISLYLPTESSPSSPSLLYL